MGGGSKKQTVGYKYYLGMHMINVHGEIDAVLRISVDDREAWSGSVANGSVFINQPDLFGGESREGGIVGTVDVVPGSQTQVQNSYLVQQLGSTVPAFRGVAALILRQVYLGLNPYLKRWSSRVQRIHKRSDGSTQWNDSNAAIGSYISRKPTASPKGWYNRGLDWFNIGAGVETSGSYTQYQGQFCGLIDSLRVTKGVARYQGLEFVVPSSEFPSDSSDPYWSSVSTLLKFPGTHNGTTTTCEKGNSVVMYNGAKIITSDYKFGGSCGFFDGSDDWVKVIVGASNTDLGDVFTIDGWIKQTARENGTNYGAAIISYGEVSRPNMDTNWSIFGTSLGFVQTPYTDQSESVGVWGNVEIVPLNQWCHVALVRQGGAYWMYIDGKLCTGTSSGADMNPAHIIRECLTDKQWGMGYQDADINDASFQSAAAQLLSEGMGMSIVWDRQMRIDDFIQEVIRHIYATLYVDKSTGLFTLKLIREDYTIGSLIQLDESNILKIDNYSRPSFGDLVNSVTVNYVDSLTNKTNSVTVQDTALVQLQGSVVGTTIQYPGFSNYAIAAKTAQRDLVSLSTPLLSCTLTVKRGISNFNIGDVFKLYWPEFSDQVIAMRINSLAFGDGRNNAIKITCMEDIFTVPTTVLTSPSIPEWVDPNKPPSPISIGYVFEAPYIELVQRLGQSVIDSSLSTNPDIGYYLVSAARPDSAIKAEAFQDSSGSYVSSFYFDFAPAGKLSAAISKTDSTIVLDSSVDLDLIVVGNAGIINTEIVKILSIVGNTLTIGRGVFDTVPVSHGIGSKFLLFDINAESNKTQYVFGESFNIKLLPVSSSATSDITGVTPIPVSFDRRAIRPYPPGNLKICGSYFPTQVIDVAISITWSHRSRTQQTSDSYIVFTDGSIGPEAGTTYSVRLYNHISSALIHSIDGLTGTSYSGFPAFTGNYTLRLEVWSVRSGYTSLQKHSHIFDYLNTTYLMVEDLDNYITEAGDLLTTE